MLNEIPNIDNNNSSNNVINSKSTGMNKSVVVIISLVVLVLGIGSGYFFYTKFGKSQSSVSSVSSETISPGAKLPKGKEYGLKDVTGKDTAMGEIQKGGLDNGEGTHKLVREGGPSQTVYLISSAVDLDQFVGAKIQIWGETMKAQKAGWLMDVLKIKILE